MWISSNRLYMSNLISVQCQQVSCQRNSPRPDGVSQVYTKNQPTERASLYGWRKPGLVISRILTIAPWHKKVPCAQQDWWHLKIGWWVWKLALFSICSKTGLLHVMQDHSQPRATESTSGYLVQRLHTEAACLALTALLWRSPTACQQPAGETMEGSMSNLRRATLPPSLERWSPGQHPQLSSAPARTPAPAWPQFCWSLVGRSETHTISTDRGQNSSFPNHDLKHPFGAQGWRNSKQEVGANGPAQSSHQDHWV